MDVHQGNINTLVYRELCRRRAISSSAPQSQRSTVVRDRGPWHDESQAEVSSNCMTIFQYNENSVKT